MESNSLLSALRHWKSFCMCVPLPPNTLRIIILTPVLPQPETWQVVTVQRRVIHSKHTMGSGDWKSQ